MKPRFGTCLALLALVSCRSYEYAPHLTTQRGLVPPDRFARYGVEQAEATAIAREYGRATGAPEARAEAAMTYARTLADVADIGADPLGHRLTIRFKSGWRVGVPPIEDGISGPETLSPKTAATSARP